MTNATVHGVMAARSLVEPCHCRHRSQADPKTGAQLLLRAPQQWCMDRFRDLHAQRRAQGLCVKCAAKWTRDDRCPDMVQLHIVQELCDLFPEASEDDLPQPDSPTGSQIMAQLSVSATPCPAPVRAFSLTGSFQGKPISILLDFGSSHIFISCALGQSASGLQPVQPVLSV